VPRRGNLKAAKRGEQAKSSATDITQSKRGRRHPSQETRDLAFSLVLDCGSCIIRSELGPLTFGKEVRIPLYDARGRSCGWPRKFWGCFNLIHLAAPFQHVTLSIG
jgi:hypothetical protein